MISPKYTKFIKEYDSLKTKHEDGLLTDEEFVDLLIVICTKFNEKKKKNVGSPKKSIVDTEEDADDLPDPFIVVFD